MTDHETVLRGAVIATAGHVDHGKTALVRALTGMELDRWEEEKRRGLTIDLGFAWTALGRWAVSFIDVPGHERFVDNALVGMSSAPVTLFAVAADAGWSRQSSEHRDALAALGIRHGVVAITRRDLATPAEAARVREQVRRELAATGLARAPVVETSAVTGAGLDELRSALGEQIARAESERIEAPRSQFGGTETGRKPALESGREPEQPVRLWLDRSFSIAGAGTVVTGTLTGGALAVGDVLELPGVRAQRLIVRGLQSRGEKRERVSAVDRVAVNLREISAEDIGRGDALLTPGAWSLTRQVDTRLVWGEKPSDTVRVHIGTTEVVGHARHLAGDFLRITLRAALPLAPRDRLVLRPDHGRQVIGAVEVLALEPPPLTRRGAGVTRARELEDLKHGPAALVEQRGAISSSELSKVFPNFERKITGLTPDQHAPPKPAQRGADPAEIIRIGAWWISAQRWNAWCEQLHALVEEEHRRDPLSAGVTAGAALHALEIPAAEILPALAERTDVEYRSGRLRDPRRGGELGPLNAALTELETRLKHEPFQAPEAAQLAELGLGPRELAAAERAGRVLRLRADSADVVLLPDGPARAMRILAQLGSPFTVSQARQALGTTRRVAVPLLELLDERGWTRRLDANRREVVI